MSGKALSAKQEMMSAGSGAKGSGKHRFDGAWKSSE